MGKEITGIEALIELKLKNMGGVYKKVRARDNGQLCL